MDIHPQRKESNRWSSGVRTAVFVVVLGTIAAVTDHAFFAGPHARATPVAADAQAAPAPAGGDGFALPPELRPTQADPQAQAPTF